MAFNRNQLQTSVPLTELSVKIRQAETSYVTERLFPTKRVNKGTGKIRVYSRDNLRIETGPAGRRGVAREIDRRHGLMAFSTDEEAFRELILDKDVRDADSDIQDMKLDATQDLTDKQLLLREQRMITKAFTAGNYATGYSTTLAKAWTDPTSDPLKDIQTAKEPIRVGLAGNEADVLAISHDVWRALELHPLVKERVLYNGQGPGGAAIVTKEAVAALFGVSEIVLVGAVYNSEEEGATEVPALVPMLTGKALLLHRGQIDGLRTVGYGALLVPNDGDLGIRSYRPDDVLGEWVEARYEYGFTFKAVDSVTSGKSIAGHLLSNVAV
jgi:hypothetical protein